MSGMTSGIFREVMLAGSARLLYDCIIGRDMYQKWDVKKTISYFPK